MAVKLYVTGGSILPQADWNQTDTTKPDYIKNKPVLLGGNANCHYEGTIGVDGNNTEEIFALHSNYVTGDTFVIKTPISNNKYSYTAYIYDGTIWKAMDGNYNADNVYFDSDIVITTKAGNIDISNGAGIIPSEGKNLKQVFESIWTKEQQPTVVNPSVEINTAVKYYEIGEAITPSYSVSLNEGSYSYDETTGVSAEEWEITCNAETNTTLSGTFKEIAVTDGNCCEITATVKYSDGNIPKTNLGNECAEKQIKAGSASATKNLIVGYKPNFYGFKTTTINIGEIDSDIIRGLTNQKQTTTPVSSVTSDVSWMQFFYAVPKGRKASLIVKDSNNLPLTVKSKEVTVNHVNDVSSTYTLFYINNDAAYGATTLTLTWK